MTNEIDKTVRTINYDGLANGYDERYRGAYKPEGVASKLLDLVHDVGAERVLEVGCGTGHWLGILQDQAHVFGMDLSFGMLQKAAELAGRFSLIRGDAQSLPFSNSSFDMIYCVNVLHHFRDPSGFITNAHKLLKKNGALAVIGMNPHAQQDRWFIYDYFPGTRKTDLRRYPSPGTIADWMISAGFEDVRWQMAERIIADKHCDDVLPLSKDFTSQLTLLTSSEYAKGITRIESALRKAKETGGRLVFTVDISLSMVTGKVKDLLLQATEGS
jgi:SAM-dependent methyltransferase